MKRILALATLLLFFTAIGASVSVGAAPGVKDLGTLERGETYEVTFYITTNADEPFEIHPQYSAPLTSIFNDYSNRGYEFVPRNASQESMASWVEFKGNGQYTVDPSSYEVIQLDNGGITRAAGKFTFNLRVPDNAEPGYHAGAININPQFDTGGQGNQVRLISVPQVMFAFQVPGVADRELEITRVRGLRSGDNSARMLIDIRNTGTVTTQIVGSDLSVVGENGQTLTDISAGSMKIAPGETKVIQTTWTENGQINAGNYLLRGKTNYITGQAFVDESFAISDFIEIQPGETSGTGNATGEGQNQDKKSLPAWLVVMSIVLLGVIMYSFDIDPVWIVLIVGLVAISAFILMTNLPTYLIAVALIISVGLIYIG